VSGQNDPGEESILFPPTLHMGKLLPIDLEQCICLNRMYAAARYDPHELTVVLDGLDEGLIKIKDFLSFVTFEFRSGPVDRLRFIAACRTTDWPTAARVPWPPAAALFGV
jgi:hypothetical protein